MIIIAVSLYLPEHITTMISRAWFYYAGDDAATTRAAVGTPLAGMPPAGSEKPGQDDMDLLGTL